MNDGKEQTGGLDKAERCGHNTTTSTNNVVLIMNNMNQFQPIESKLEKVGGFFGMLFMATMVLPMVILAIFEGVCKVSKLWVKKSPTVRPTNGLDKATELVQNTTIANDSE